ncbi:MAG: MgtC/SapB family protein [Neisseriaceae bacterium]
MWTALNGFFNTGIGSTFLNLGLAFFLGSLIGLERQYRHRTAGIRTNVLVCLGAAIFVNMSTHFGTEGIARVVSYVVSGIGFLGAGVILRDEGSVHGVNTAATLWGAAGIGACCGAGCYSEALVACFFVLSANTILRPLVNYIQGRPSIFSFGIGIDLNLMTHSRQQKEILVLVQELCSQYDIFMEHFDIQPFGKKEVEISLRLNVDRAQVDKIEALVQELEKTEAIKQIFWALN